MSILESTGSRRPNFRFYLCYITYSLMEWRYHYTRAVVRPKRENIHGDASSVIGAVNYNDT